MKSFISLIIMLFAVSSLAQESYLSDQDRQRQKDLRNARLNETERQPIQILHKPAAYGFLPKAIHTNSSTTTFKNESGIWLKWDNGINFNAIGTLEDPLMLDIAVRFEPADLIGLDEMFITKIRLFLADNAAVTLKMWQGANFPQEIYSQDIAEFNIENWTEVELVNPVAIDTSQDLWVGYNITISSGAYPIGVDEGPTVEGKGDWLQIYDETGFPLGWETLTSYVGPNFNWNIQALAESIADGGAPSAPENLLVSADSNGLLSATIEWKNPSQTFDGQELTSLNNISLYRDQTLIQTFSNPQPGEEESFSDENVPTDGVYIYKVVGENQVGQGVSSITNVFVGEDVPAAPLNAALIQDDGNATLTWDAPQTGINNGYINPTLTRYSVMRMPGGTTLAENLSATSFTDTENLPPGNYFYKIIASNNQGSGGTANSNVVSLGIDGKLFFEAFDYPPGSFPSGWQQTGTTHNWSISQTSMAGGSAPELVLSWTPQATGTSRMISPVINADNYTGLRVSFKQYLANFSSYSNESVALEFRTDNSNNWQTIWEQTLNTEDIPQDDYDFSFALPENTTSFQVAFRFQGNSFNIDYWYIDDLSIEPLLGNNLAANTVSGNTIPSVGTESVYIVTVANLGEFAATDYTVKLMGAGDVELASVSGQTIQSGQVLQYQLPWTPEQAGNTFIFGKVDYILDEFTGNNSSPNLQLQVQPEGTFVVEVGEDNYLSNNIPINFFWKQSLAQTIYLAEELGISGGVVTSLMYNSIFSQNLGNKEIRVWLGETDQNDLAEQPVDFENFTLVFDGTINFPQGENNFIIPFDNPYAYSGRNLVVYTDKVWEDNFYGPGNAFIVSHDSIIRSRTQISDEQIFPENSDLSTISWQYPNTTFFFSLEGLGSIEGTISHNNEPLEGVKVKIANKPTNTTTNQNGIYTLPNLLAGEYDLEISKFGYLPQTIIKVIVAEEETTRVNVVMEAIPQYAVTGKVEGNDGLIPSEVTISLTGYSNYSLTIDNDGFFETDDVYEGEYLLSIYAPGYDFYRDENIVVNADTDLGIIILSEIILSPKGLTVDYDNFGAGNALLSWSKAGELAEFRYDSGTGSSYIGTNFGSFDAVMGTAHPNAAVLFEMSWIFSNGSENVNNETVRVKIFGLDDNNLPDRNQVLYSSGDIVLNNSGWTTYQFTEPVNAPNGFFMGISTESFLFVLTDDGLDPEWPFQNNTHFVNFDVTSDDFHPLELFGYQENFFIRANGYNLGAPKMATMAGNTQGKNIPDFQAEKITIEPYNLASPFANNLEVKSQKAFTGYNIYLNNLETPVAFTEELEFLFTEISEGDQVAGVQSVYTTGVSEIVTLEFEVVYPVEVTLNISTNSGESAEGASITLTNQDNSNYNFSALVDETGVVFFESVRKGTYILQAKLENYQSQQITNLMIQDDLEINIEFTQIIDPPVNLMVLTEGLEAGQALFSWNNPTHGWTESFEEGILPENWSQIITNTGSQAGFDATWRIVETVSFSNSITPQNGTYQAYVMWSFEQQDEWLISPEFTAPAGDLVFWYHGINGSTFGDNYYVKITTDGGNNWTTLWNASNLPSGLNHFTTPVTIDLSLFSGQKVKLAWHADDGPSGVGLWSSWAIDNISVGGEPMNLKNFAINEKKHNTPDKNAIGYNVYLDGTLVAENVQENQYLFSNIADGPRVAGVEAVYTTGTSDRVVKEFILRETWLLSLASNPAGSGSLSGAAWYAEGSEVLINALSNDGYAFINWTNIAGELISDQPSFFYTMPGNDAVLIANYEAVELYSVTFNIDMSAMPGYNPFENDVALTGSMHNWAVLGANHRNQTMAGDHTSMIYSKTFTLSPGTYQYKYFLNEGQHDNEWEDGDNREIIVNTSIVVHDVWGVATQVENVPDYDQVRVFPNPFTNHLEILGAEMAERIIITNILGKVVMNEPINGNILDTSSLPVGVYVILLEGSLGAYPVQKLIKK